MKRIPINGDRIKSLRDAAGLNQHELADQLGCDNKTICRAEKNKGGSYPLLSKIAERFDVPVHELIATG